MTRFNVNTEYNPYAPPDAPLGDECRLQRVKPRTAVWAIAALWAAYGITLAHAIIARGDLWLSWPPGLNIINQAVFELVCAVLIYFVSRGQHWASVIYGLYLVVRTIHVIRTAPAEWQGSHSLFLMTVVSFTCQYVAMYWLFIEPGRRWFARSQDTA